MRWIAAIFVGLTSLAGCEITSQERAQEYNEDGVNLFQHAKYRDACESFQAARALQGDDPGLLFNIGECYDRMGDAAKAEQYYRNCLARVPNHAPCHHALGVLLVRQKRQREAEELVHDWLAHEPRLAAAYAEDGWLAHLAGDLPRAQGRLQQALELDPHDVRALTELGQVYEEMQRPDRAMVLYERILKEDPKQTDISERVNILLAKGVKRPHPE